MKNETLRLIQIFIFGGFRAAVTSLLMCFLPWNVQAADGLTPQQIAKIKAIGAEIFARDKLPGLSIAVATGNQIWSAGFGHADLEQDVLVDSRSMFRTASITKWMTATAAMRLVEDGKLDLDVPIQQYCPEYPRKQWPISTRFLLSHLSGIRHYHGANGEPHDTEEQRRSLDEQIKQEQARQYTRYTELKKALDAFKEDPLRFPPGTDFLYTSLGYRVLGCVLEGAAQIPYRELMRNLIYLPAGMKSITEDDSIALVPHRVAGYARSFDNVLIRAPFRDISDNLPAGGQLATAEDLVRFAIAFNSGKLVRADTRDRMVSRPALANGANAPGLPLIFGIGPGFHYGMGIFVGSTGNGEQLLMHNGRQPGASTQLLLMPQREIAVAAMANLSGWNAIDKLLREIANVAASEE